MLKTVIISISLLGLFIFFPLAFAQETVPLTTPGGSPAPVEYALPYPGILPDHPLYLFKSLRDQILLLLISSPVKKVEFYILLADKHLNMTISLLDKEKPNLAIKTLQKGIEYLKQAEKLIFEIPISENAQVANDKHRLEKSILKHRELTRDMVERVSGEDKEAFTQLAQEIDTLFEDFTNKD